MVEWKLPKYSNLFDTSTPETQRFWSKDFSLRESQFLFKLKHNQCGIAPHQGFARPPPLEPMFCLLSAFLRGKIQSFPQQPSCSLSLDMNAAQDPQSEVRPPVAHRFASPHAATNLSANPKKQLNAHGTTLEVRYQSLGTCQCLYLRENLAQASGDEEAPKRVDRQTDSDGPATR